LSLTLRFISGINIHENVFQTTTNIETRSLRVEGDF
jgi:hypothetical protein